jgi:hypothetical protein
MNMRALLLTTMAVASLSSPAFAQGVAEMEGRVTDLTVNTNRAVTAIKVFNTNVPVPTGPIFSTPTRDGMTRAQIGACNDIQFAGKKRRSTAAVDSLYDGTAIIVGTSTDVTTNGVTKSVVTPESIFVEPAENVLLGRISSVPTFDTVLKEELDPATGEPVIDPVTNQPKMIATKVYGTGTLEIEGTPVVVLGKEAGGHFPPVGTVSHNPCIPGLGLKNDAGFPLPPEALAKNADAAAEGWYGDDGKFYAFLIETVGANPDQQTAVSITRAQCRNRSATRMEWEVRGGTADPVSLGAGRVNIGRVTATGPELYTGAFTTAVADPVNPPYGLYTFKADINNQGQCPDTVVVRYNGSGARAGVDVR